MLKFVAALLISASSIAALAQTEGTKPAGPVLPSEPFTKADAEAVVPALADLLDQNFVSPAVAKLYASALRAKLAAGGYSTFADKASFARAVTADLQEVAHDGHLRVLSPAMVERVKA